MNNFFTNVSQYGNQTLSYARKVCPIAAKNLGELSNFRSDLGLKIGEGTLAKPNIGEKISMSVNAISRTHAEADAFQQALNSGVKEVKEATLYVDRALCLACGQNGGVKGMVRQLGLEKLIVYTPECSQIIRP